LCIPFLYLHKGGEETEPLDKERLPLSLILLLIRSYARGLKSSSNSSNSKPSSFVPTDGWADDSKSLMKLFSPNGLLPLLASKALGGTGGGCPRLAVMGGLLIPLLDPVLKFRRFPFSC
jgi:hypothetical protein